MCYDIRDSYEEWKEERELLRAQIKELAECIIDLSRHGVSDNAEATANKIIKEVDQGYRS